jgi:predicted Fe-Mo cluster-binding NifX family protein
VQKIKVAIPTEGEKGLGDVVSEVFGRSRTFTIVDLEEETISDVHVVENPTVSYKHGAGPIVVKMLVDMEVNVVMSREFGPGALTLLEQHNVKTVKVKSGVLVSEVINKDLKKLL